MNQKEVNKLLEGLFDGGYIFEKKIGRATPSAGAIYLPKKLIGKNFRVILVPMNESEDVEKSNENTQSLVEPKEFPLPVEEESKPASPEETPQDTNRFKINTGITEKQE